MSSDDTALQPMKFQKFAHLIGVSGGEDNFVAASLQFLHDWNKEGNVGRIVEIDPDFL
jgi:hypothetical protein